VQDFESDTTDHYTENGSFMNDHIVNKPKKITLNGFVGELVYNKPAPGSLNGRLSQLAGRLGQLAGIGGNYTPGFTQAVQGIVGQAQAAAKQVEQVVGQVQGVLGAISSFYNNNKITKQRAAYDRLLGLWQSKTIFTITTPWDELSPMVISGMSFRQDADSNDYTTIKIDFKEFRFAGTSFVKLKGADVTVGATTAVQSAASESQGTAGSNKTFLKTAADSVSNGQSKNVVGGLTKAFGL
jgi:hypothetical protein